MASFDFSPAACGVSLTIQCPACEEEFETGSLPVPTPDWTAETHRDSVMNDTHWISCPYCENEIVVELYNGIYGGEGEVNVDDDHFKGCYEDYIEDDGYDYDKELFDASHAEITKMVDAVESLPEEPRSNIYKMLYAKTITNMETYLGDTLKKYVLNDDKYLRLFVETYEPYAKELCHVSDAYKIVETVKDRVKVTLCEEIIYHNLPKLKGIYRCVFNIDFGDIKELMQAVSIRHDIVHRNGKDQDGNEHKITKEDVLAVAEKVNNFIYAIDMALPIIKS